jgi:Zn-dependent metalloprotease
MKYEQVYEGLSVFSAVLRVHQDRNGRFVAANGDFYPIPATLDTTPSVSVETATAVAQAELNSVQATLEALELVVVDPGWYGDSPQGARLAYFIILRDDGVSLREAFFVDAHDGEVLDR